MPDPSQLKIGDRVRFIAIPEEWSRPGFHVHDGSRTFMDAMIERRFLSRIFKIDADGVPWDSSSNQGKQSACLSRMGYSRIHRLEAHRTALMTITVTLQHCPESVTHSSWVGYD